MKGVIYARYSSDSQREESIEGQIRECKEFAERNGITILTSYIDRALSAKSDNRPEFQRMIKDSAKRLFDVVIVWKLDRFARNRYDSAHYKTILRKNSVKLLSAKEVIAEDSSGILLESMLEGMAEYYSAELAEKVVRGMTENALKSKFNGGGRTVGYVIDDDRHFQIDPVTAPVILETFKRYDEGATIAELVRWHREQDFRSGSGKPMRIDCVQRLLKNRRYIGEYRYREVVQPDGIPAIVPLKLFERVQARMEKNKKAPARFKAVNELYLLSTKLYCGKCGAFMVGESGTGRGGIFHQYYKCVTVKRKKGCTKKSVKKDWIENLVIGGIMDMLFTDGMIHYLTDTVLELQKRENLTIPVIKQQLAEAERGIENMLNAIQQGILTPTTKQRLEALEETKSNLEVSLLQEELQRPLLTREQIIFWLHKYRETDVTNPEQRQRLVDGFINAIYLYDDRIVITFNYKDGAKTITLDEVNGSDLAVGGAPKKSLKWGFFITPQYFFRIYCGVKSVLRHTCVTLCPASH